MRELSELRRKRFMFLEELYKLAGNKSFKSASISKIAQNIGIETELAYEIVNYLIGEQLVTSPSYHYVEITHQGVREVEQALSEPNEPTKHFPPVNVIYVNQMTHSQIQQGSPSATQTMDVSGIDHSQLERFLEQLKASLDNLDLEPEQKAEVEADIQTIEAQMTSTRPKHPIIIMTLTSIKNVLEQATGSAIAGLLPQLSALLLSGQS